MRRKRRFRRRPPATSVHAASGAGVAPGLLRSLSRECTSAPPPRHLHSSALRCPSDLVPEPADIHVVEVARATSRGPPLIALLQMSPRARRAVNRANATTDPRPPRPTTTPASQRPPATCGGMGRWGLGRRHCLRTPKRRRNFATSARDAGALQRLACGKSARRGSHSARRGRQPHCCCTATTGSSHLTRVLLRAPLTGLPRAAHRALHGPQPCRARLPLLAASLEEDDLARAVARLRRTAAPSRPLPPPRAPASASSPSLLLEALARARLARGRKRRRCVCVCGGGARRRTDCERARVHTHTQHTQQRGRVQMAPAA